MRSELEMRSVRKVLDRIQPTCHKGQEPALLHTAAGSRSPLVRPLRLTVFPGCHMTSVTSLRLRRSFVAEIPFSVPLPSAREWEALLEVSSITEALRDGTPLPPDSPGIVAAIRVVFRYAAACARAIGDEALADIYEFVHRAGGRHRRARQDWIVRTEGVPDPTGFLAAFTGAELRGALGGVR